MFGDNRRPGGIESGRSINLRLRTNDKGPSSQTLNYKFAGTIRWESALPVRQVSKSFLSDRFSNQYVLSVRGLPIGDGVSVKGEPRLTDAEIESIRRVSSLTVENWMRSGPAVPAQAVQMAGDALLLGFPHQALHFSGRG
jgi:hypothetical protein